MRKLKNEELKRPSLEEYQGLKKLPVALILDNVRSLHNVGAAFRTSDAFLIEQLYLTGITGTPPHRDIEKTALGATDSVKWQYVEDSKQIIGKLKNDGYLIIGIEQADKSTSLHDFKVTTDGKLALVFGNEVFGIDEKVFNLCDEIIEIPQSGTKHSLNISVSLGIVLWEVYRKMFLQ